jgi:hypothetical protein
MRTSAIVFVAMILVAESAAFASVPDEVAHVQLLSPIASTPQNLLCSEPGERGMQFIACDAYKTYGEPISPVTQLGRTKLAIRFVWAPSFHTWSVVRVEISTPTYGTSHVATSLPEGTLTVRTETEDPGHNVRGLMEPDAKSTIARTFKLRRDEVWLILETLNLHDVFSLPSTRDETESCLDGTDYVVEVAEVNRYHWALLTCRYKDDPRETNLYRLSSLLGLLVRAYVPQELPDFPGD